MRKMPSAASRVCATCTVSTPRRGNGLQEELPGDPGGDAHLARLDDDVLLAAVLLEPGLHRIGFELALVAGCDRES